MSGAISISFRRRRSKLLVYLFAIPFSFLRQVDFPHGFVDEGATYFLVAFRGGIDQASGGDGVDLAVLGCASRFLEMIREVYSRLLREHSTETATFGIL